MSRNIGVFNAPNYLTIPPKVWKKIMYYCINGEGEMSGLARIRIKKADAVPDSETFEITDARIFKQHNTAAHTTLREEELHRFLYSLIRKGRRTGDWYCWWHTHNDFTQYFSGEDVNTIKRLSAESRLVSLVVNKFGASAARFDMGGQTKTLSVCIVPETGTKLYKRIRREVKRKVTYEGYTTHGRRGYEESDIWSPSWSGRKRATYPEAGIVSTAVGYPQPEEVVEVVSFFGRGRERGELHSPVLGKDGHFVD